MERLKCMRLKTAFFWLTFWCVLSGLLLGGLAVWGCARLRESVAPGASLLVTQGGAQMLPAPEVGQGMYTLARVLDVLQLILPIVLLLAALAIADMLFYRLKLRKPIETLNDGAQRIMTSDLDFSMEASGGDELGALCGAFEAMRAQLLENNQALWRQSEERRRLNAAFSHDLRNPLAVLQGTVQLLRRQGRPRLDQLDQLERCIGRIRQYVEAMGSAARLEDLPVRPRSLPFDRIRTELFDSARILARDCICRAEGDGAAACTLDLELFLQAAENLLSNGARFGTRVQVSLLLEETRLVLTVIDDGPGYPEDLLREGPRPFCRGEEEGHFGMGLYICQVLCRRMGGGLTLSNREGAAAQIILPRKNLSKT